jgi:ABC-2 type transport system ATP-binding protein
MANFNTNSDSDLKQMVEDASTISGLGDRLSDRVKTYSKGMKRRLLVARALMNKPRLAILDEPTSGLDILHAYHVREIIKKYSREYKVTVLLSSHNMLEVEQLCDQVSLVNKGKIIVEGSPNELKSKHKASNLEEVFVEVAGLA